MATELAANAVRHSASGRGGYFAVEISWLARRPPSASPSRTAGDRPALAGPGPRAPAWPRWHRPAHPARSGLPPGAAARGCLPGPGGTAAEPLTESGRGLRLVRALAAGRACAATSRAWLVWADVRWDADDQPEPGFPDGYRAALRDVQAVLAARYPEAAVWFGQATMHWWAMAGDPVGGPDSRLLTAASALELARLLDLDRARQRLVRRREPGTPWSDRPAA